MKKLLSVILAIVLVISTIPLVAVAATESNIVVLYTNDVHCAIDDYAVLAAYRADLISDGHTVITVDVGDAIQGEVIGTLTEGEAVVDIMNTVGYDYAVPGNHEYDYGMEQFLDIEEKQANYKYISSNFYYLPGVRGVFDAYAIEEINGTKIAFVGITTPETVSKANPQYFKDENNNFIYGFPTWDMQDGVLYENVQESVDKAKAEGADLVIALGHLGIQETTDGWKSTDVIANTNGIDYFLDAHSHETIEADTYQNKDNKDVVLSSTGTKFNNFGVMTINDDGDATFELVNPDTVDVDTLSADAKTAYNTVKAKIDGYNKEIEYLYEVIGTSEAELIAYDTDNSWLVRKQETNAGDFAADAYRAVTGADVALCNGGGIRSEIPVGDVTRKMLMDMNPWSNSMCVLEITGQQLIDVLEHGARSCPESLGGFFQVSGVTFEINTWRETPVITDTNGNFQSIDETMERRVQNVLVDGEPIDLEKKYTVAGTEYVLIDGGDGLTMLEGARVVQQEGLLCDSQMLIKYLEMLGGTIPSEKYGNPDGDGRIEIIDTEPVEISYDYEIKYGETITISTKNYDSGEYTYIRFIPETSGRFALESAAGEEIDPLCELYNAEMNYLDGNDDSDGLNFSLKYDFIEGETYYFAVATYAQEAEIDVSLVCGHSYEDGICTVCGKECTHELDEDKLCYCACGEVFFGKDIYSGDEVEFDSAEYENYAYFRFIPEEDGLYVFESVSNSASSDPICNLYDSTFEELEYSDDEIGRDFFLVYEFSQGETYYFEVLNNASDEVCTLKLYPAIHTADDGAEHKLEYVDGTYSTCTEHGYTAGLYCPECDEYIKGHEEKELSDYHSDDDENGYCDDCGAEITCDYHCDYDDDGYCDDCGEQIYFEEISCIHICHSDNVVISFIWEIMNFINKLLNINATCECGEVHY